MVEFFIAFKHIIERKFQSIFSVLGVAIAVTVFIVSLTVSNGLEKNMINSLLTMSPHILIKNKKSTFFENYNEIIEKYKKLGELQDYSFDLSLNTKLSFEYSIELAEKLEIENTRILHNLSEIDSYFLD